MTTVSHALSEATTQFGAFSLVLTVSADFDTTIFGLMTDSTLTSTQATSLWTYSDGYQFSLISESKASLSTNTAVHCLQKTYSSILAAASEAGAICFSSTGYLLTGVTFY